MTQADARVAGSHEGSPSRGTQLSPVELSFLYRLYEVRRGDGLLRFYEVYEQRHIAQEDLRTIYQHVNQTSVCGVATLSLCENAFGSSIQGDGSRQTVESNQNHGDLDSQGPASVTRLRIRDDVRCACLRDCDTGDKGRASEGDSENDASSKGSNFL